jgi:hypothetical protein
LSQKWYLTIDNLLSPFVFEGSLDHQYESSETGCAWDKKKATEAARAPPCCPWQSKEGYGVLVHHKGRRRD